MRNRGVVSCTVWPCQVDGQIHHERAQRERDLADRRSYVLALQNRAKQELSARMEMRDKNRKDLQTEVRQPGHPFESAIDARKMLGLSLKSRVLGFPVSLLQEARQEKLLLRLRRKSLVPKKGRSACQWFGEYQTSMNGRLLGDSWQAGLCVGSYSARLATAGARNCAVAENAFRAGPDLKRSLLRRVVENPQSLH